MLKESLFIDELLATHTLVGDKGVLPRTFYWLRPQVVVFLFESLSLVVYMALQLTKCCKHLMAQALEPTGVAELLPVWAQL